MLLKDFYRKVILTEDTAVSFLREHNLLDAPQEAAPCQRCGSVMQEKRRRDRGGDFRSVLRCPRKGCQTSRSVRKGNTFFHFTDINSKLNCKLSLCEILELVLFFILEIPTDTAVTLTGKSYNTVADWYNMCREVCGIVVSHRTRGKMVGTEDNPIQIDKLRFAGRRNCNRGRMLNSTPKSKAPLSEDSDAVVQNNKNHGATIDEHWVFGLKQGSECRYFYVQWRDKNTLIPIIQRECESGSVIHSDEWPDYGSLNSIGFRHFSFSRQENDIYPATEAIEQSWLDTKIRSLKKMRGASEDHFQSHLDHFCWKVLRKDADDLFAAFLNDIQSVYR